MHKHYDAALKTLVENHPRDWVQGLGLPLGKTVEVIDADVSTVTSQADKVIHVAGAKPFLLHLELQTSYDESLASRMFQYNALLYARHRIPVHSAVVLLRKQAGYQMSGRLNYTIGRGGSIDFRYQTIKIWQRRAAEFMKGGRGLLPLAPLTNVSADETRGILRAMDQRLNIEAPQERKDIFAATLILLGLRYEGDLAQDLMKEVRGMKESTTYQYILEEGRREGEAKGERKGERKGEVKGARKLLRKVGSRRLGEPSARVQAAIDGLNIFAEIEQLMARVPDVSSWDELFKKK